MGPLDANFKNLFFKIRNYIKLHIFAQRDVEEFDLLIEEGDTLIAIQNNNTCVPQKKDIPGGSCIALGNGKRRMRLVPVFLALTKRRQGISPVVEWPWWLL
jgi:hypothetical protein